MATSGLSAQQAGQLLNLPKTNGPFFLDTGMCKCALRTSKSPDSAWRCIGNGNSTASNGNTTTDLYMGSSGKWFNVKGGDTGISPPSKGVSDATWPPDNSTTLVAGPGSTDTVVNLVQWDGKDNSTLNIWDQACTGVNNTAQSAVFYQTQEQVNNGQVPYAAQVCFTGGTPLPIQNATDWYANGCQEGFWCPNNTINSLPEYCIPLPVCQGHRLAGLSCSEPQGYFEPMLCPQGYYCPNGGKDMIECPAGSFCPPGSTAPIPCSVGSVCNAQSYYNQPLIPVAVLVLWNIGIIIAYFVLRTMHHKKMHRSAHHAGVMGVLRKANPSQFLQPASHRKRTGSEASILSEDALALEANIRSEEEHKNPDETFLTADTDYGPAPGQKEHEGELEAFVRSLSRCIQGSSFGLSFNWKNLVYAPKAGAKPILSDVSGQIKGGSLVGVMGGSGAGKSTFVNVLMGKRGHTGGETKVNGVAGNIAQYKKIIGYVPQDDVLLTELSVRENILHSARIRLPSNWSDKEIQEHVDILIQCLKLDHVRDSIVGSPGKGVSGGQRKRVSIGMELAAAPMALFLDEPTSGLDATAASSIMELLKALSRLGITIVTIIHQPRQEIFEAMDDLILLGKGRMLYCGPIPEVQAYFEGDCGFKFPPLQNPADVIMDIINGEGRQYKRVGETGIEALIEHWHNKTASMPEPPIIVPPQDEVVALRRSIRKRGAPWPRQILLCLNRSMLQQYRTSSGFWFEMGVATLAGLLIGLAENSEHGLNFRGTFFNGYIYLGNSLDFTSVGQLSLLVGIAIGLVSAAPGVKVFGEEKEMFYREAASGHNRFAYYMGKIVSVLPRMVLAAFHFTTMFMLLATPTMAWIESFIANLLYFYCIYGLASVVSMVTRREDGPLLAVMATLIVGTLSGEAPTLAKVDTWHLTWLWRASPGTWLSEAYFDKNVSPTGNIYDIDMAAEQIGYNLGQYGLDLAILTAIGSIYRVVAYLGLRFLNRSRQK